MAKCLWEMDRCDGHMGPVLSRELLNGGVYQRVLRDGVCRLGWGENKGWWILGSREGKV